MLLLLQLIAVAAVGAYLCCRVMSLRARNHQSWNALVARLNPDWNARELIDCAFSECHCAARLWEKLRRIHGFRGLWTIFENVGVMLEMADFAGRNSDCFDEDVLTDIRREAMQVRVLVLTAFVRYAFSAVNETVSMSVLRVESAYSEMAMRITEVLDSQAPEVLRGFVSAM